MIKIFKIKNWEIFLILFLIPFLINLILSILIKTVVPAAIFMLIWVWIISIWLFKLADYFKTDYLGKFEIKLFVFNLIVINLIFIVIVPIALIMFYKGLHSMENAFNILSKTDDYVRIYIYVSTLAILVIASRILTAKRLQRNLRIEDYYKSAISFVFLPVGIFWIQNEINEILKNENLDNKNRGHVLIGLSILLTIVMIFSYTDCLESWNYKYKGYQRKHAEISKGYA